MSSLSFFRIRAGWALRRGVGLSQEGGEEREREEVVVVIVIVDDNAKPYSVRDRQTHTRERTHKEKWRIICACPRSSNRAKPS